MIKRSCYLLFLLLTTGCISLPKYASLNSTSELRGLHPFTRVQISGSDSLFIDYGESYQVKLVGHADLVNGYLTEVKQGTLFLGSRPRGLHEGNLYVVVTLPKLDQLIKSKSEDVRLASIQIHQRLYHDKLKLDITGTAIVNISA